MPIFTAPDGIQLHLISPTGDTLAILSDTDRSGPILDARVTDLKIGGVDTFSFRIAKDFDFPLSRNTECHFYVNSNLWFIGYITEVPQQDQNDPVLEVVGQGFVHRLKSKIITSTQTSQTLDTIIKVILSANLGEDLRVLYDVAKITTPVIVGLTVEYNDANLFDVLEELLGIANFDYDTARFRFYVDNENEFVFEQIPTTIQLPHLFEGFDYQAPDVTEDNSALVNRVSSYRATTADPKVVEFVSTREDTASQANFGLFEKKITYPSFLSTNAINDIADFILARRKLPETKINIENFLLGDVAAPLVFGIHALSNRRGDYREILFDGSDVSDWTTGDLVSTSLGLSSVHVLTGKQSMLITTTGLSNGSFTELTLPRVVPFPHLARAFVYFSAPQHIRVSFFSVDGREISIEFGDVGSTPNEWLRKDVPIMLETLLSDYQVVTPTGISPPEDLLVVSPTAGSTPEVLGVRTIVVDGILDIEKIRITILTANGTFIWIDLVDASITNYNYHELLLEQVDYNLSSLGLFANLFFGDKDDNVFTEIGEQVKDGDIALGVVSKQ